MSIICAPPVDTPQRSPHFMGIFHRLQRVPMPRPLLYYVRHGETAWNAEGRVRGSRDIPLNGKGMGQGSAAGTFWPAFEAERA